MLSERVDTDTLHIDEMHVVCPRAGGLDVHKMCITAAVRLCEAGRGLARTAVREFSALPDGLRAMTELADAGQPQAVAGIGLLPADLLDVLGIEQVGVNAGVFERLERGLPVDPGAFHRGGGDAVRPKPVGLALPSYVPPRRFRQLRQLTRYRRTLVAERSRTRNRVHKTLDHDGLRLGGILSDIFGVNGRRILDGLVAGRPPRRILAGLTSHVAAKLEPLAQALAATLDPLALLKLQMQMEALDRADAALATLDKRIRAELADHQRPLQLLQTIPGIDLGSACTLFVEIGPDLGAFREARHLGAWAGVAPGNNTSAGKRRSGRARKGNPTLRATLAECAHGAARTKSSQFYDYHRMLAGRIGYKRAILATAHKLLRVMHTVLREDRPYTDPDVDYEQLVVERNAPRWIRMLKQHGFLDEAQAAARG